MLSFRQILAIIIPLLVCSPALAAPAAQLKKLLPAWSYDGDLNGQQHWSEITKAYRLCDTGQQQSPVNIAFTDKSKPVPVIKPLYKTSHTHVYAATNMLQVNIKDGGAVEENGDIYTLHHIQFHTPSEHSIKERYYPLEIQFVNEDAKGKLLIISAFATLGGGRHGFKVLLDHLHSTDTFDFDPTWILPSGGGYYAYTGSMTYPPCLEGIEWRILKRPMSISQAQLDGIAAIVSRNARAVQPLYMRSIAESPD